VVANTISRGQIGTTMVLLILAVGCVLLGSILSFSQLLDRLVEPVIVSIDEDIKDDLEDIKAKRLKNVQLMVIITGAAVFIFLMYILKLHKFEATWGKFPVVILTILAAGIVAMVITQTNWFKDQTLTTPLYIFFIPVIGIVLSMILGISRAEDTRNLSRSVGDTATYNNFVPMGLNIFANTAETGVFDFSLPSCNDDACSIIVLVIALIVITFVLVIGSAFIPHFWFLSTWVLLTILTLITIHEIRIRRTAPKTSNPLDPYHE
jgi:hypothetical protein